MCGLVYNVKRGRGKNAEEVSITCSRRSVPDTGNENSEHFLVLDFPGEVAMNAGYGLHPEDQTTTILKNEFARFNLGDPGHYNVVYLWPHKEPVKKDDNLFEHLMHQRGLLSTKIEFAKSVLVMGSRASLAILNKGADSVAGLRWTMDNGGLLVVTPPLRAVPQKTIGDFRLSLQRYREYMGR